MREEGAGQVADALRVEKIELHEALDRALARPLGELHALCDPALEIEGQPVLGPPGEGVEVAAHRAQDIFGARELPEFARREQPRVDQFGDRADPGDVLADPDPGMELQSGSTPSLPSGFAPMSR